MTTHDSQAWNLSELGLKIAAGGLDSKYFINGDSAYVQGKQMVIPYGKPEFTDFDYVQSSNRICIECAFGVMQLFSHSLVPLLRRGPSVVTNYRCFRCSLARCSSGAGGFCGGRSNANSLAAATSSARACGCTTTASTSGLLTRSSG